MAGFYGHMIASVCFIGFKEIKFTFNPKAPKETHGRDSDILRQAYEHELPWYIFNFLLSFMPVPLVIMQENHC